MNKNNESFYTQLNFIFVTNNVKGLQSSKKRWNLFEYFKTKVSSKDTLLLQERRYSVESGKQ